MSDMYKLNADDVCKIIKASKAAGISELTYGNLVLKFRPLGPVDVAQPSQAASSQMLANQSEVPTTVNVMNEQALEDAEEAQLLIDDPHGYERLQMLRDLERNRVMDG